MSIQISHLDLENLENFHITLVYEKFNQLFKVHKKPCPCTKITGKLLETASKKSSILKESTNEMPVASSAPTLGHAERCM